MLKIKTSSGSITTSNVSNLNLLFDEIYSYFKKVDVIANPDENSYVHDKTFWEHVVPKRLGAATTKKRSTQQKENVELNDHERRVLETFMDKPTLGINDAVESKDNDNSICDDLSVSLQHSNNGNMSETAQDVLAQDITFQMVEKSHSF